MRSVDCQACTLLRLAGCYPEFKASLLPSEMDSTRSTPDYFHSRTPSPPHQRFLLTPLAIWQKLQHLLCKSRARPDHPSPIFPLNFQKEQKEEASALHWFFGSLQAGVRYSHSNGAVKGQLNPKL